MSHRFRAATARERLTEEARFIEAVGRGDDALRRGEFLTHEQVGNRLERFLNPR